MHNPNYIITYEPGYTFLEIATTKLNRLGPIDVISSIIFTESELNILFKSWIKQRAKYRRLLRFVDPSMS